MNKNKVTSIDLKEIVKFVWKKDKSSLLGVGASLIAVITSIYKLDLVWFCLGCYILHMNASNIGLMFQSENNNQIKKTIDLLSTQLDIQSQRIDLISKKLTKSNE